MPTTKKTTRAKKSVAGRKPAAKTSGKPRTIKVADEPAAESGTQSPDSAADAKPVKGPKAKPRSAGKRLSALDAAAKVLAESTEPMNTKEMVEAMAAKGYWSTPGGKTPHATLYSAILREIKAKGNDARFTKTERGKFTAKS